MENYQQKEACRGCNEAEGLSKTDLDSKLLGGSSLDNNELDFGC